MNSSATGTLTKSGGCGCGGSGGGTSARPCSCTKAGCQECETHGLLRPRFFAGQLLTEDDLEALTTYVVSKQRLQTRHLHGAGVVCGLEVQCPPCEGGTVVVQPGYAIDCCGNDIVVPCATELDILAMIRQLRIDSRGGHDCGDPCADSKAARRRDRAPTPVPGRMTKSLAATAGSINENPIIPVQTKPPDEEEPNPFREKYCLYVRYCETPTDPVKPFVVDEPCGDGSACEFTRVREGYRFELRCPEDHKPAPTVADRIAACTNLDELKEAIRAAEVSSPRILRDEYATALLERAEPLKLADDDPKRMFGHVATLQKFSTAFPLTAGQPPDKQPTDAEFRAVLDTFNDLARIAARAGAVAADGQVPDAVMKATAEARVTMTDVEPLLRGRLDLFTSSEDLQFARAVLNDASRFVIADAPVELKKSPDAAYFIYGGTQSQELSTLDFQYVVQLRQWLKRRVGTGVASDCRLLADLDAIQIDAQDVYRRTVLQTTRRKLLEIQKRYVAACMCSALLPPCSPCDDTAVLLACLTVEECDVVDVCNLKRTFVLSWPAMRYWVPWFGEIGEVFEKLCCEPRKVAIPAQGFTTNKAFGDIDLLSQREAQVLAQSAKMASTVAARSPLETVFRLAAPRGNAAAERLAHVLGRTVLPAPGELPSAAEAAIVPQGEPLAEALRAPEPRRLISDLIDGRVDELRPRSELADVVDDVDARLKVMNATVAELSRQIKKRPTAADIAAAPPVKKLVTAAGETSKRLDKINAELLAQVDVLKTRIEQLEGK